MNKRGQFFLLAAVIISAMIISMGTGMNRAIVSDEPGDFYDFSYEVKREIGAVLDYDVYTGFDGSTNLNEFVDLLAKDMAERNPDAGFIILYGNESDMNVGNSGLENVSVNGNLVNSLTVGSGNIYVGNSHVSSTGRNEFVRKRVVLGNSNRVSVSVGETSFDFPVSKNNQVFFIMQKDVGEDRYIISG